LPITVLVKSEKPSQVSLKDGIRKLLKTEDALLTRHLGYLATQRVLAEGDYFQGDMLLAPETQVSIERTTTEETDRPRHVLLAVAIILFSKTDWGYSQKCGFGGENTGRLKILATFVLMMNANYYQYTVKCIAF